MKRSLFFTISLSFVMSNGYAAVCNGPDSAPTSEALAAAAEVWIKTQNADEYIHNCIFAPEIVCEVSAPMSWHRGDDPRDHLTWRIGPDSEEPHNQKYRTVHIYSISDNQKPPFQFVGFSTGPKTGQCK